MDSQRRKELKEQYKQMKTYMGVFQIRNLTNGKILIAASPNLKNKWLTLRQQLDAGRYANAALQRDWKSQGADAFAYEVLEEKSTEDMIDVRWEMEQMEKAWVLKLLPYGEKGYHKKPAGMD